MGDGDKPGSVQRYRFRVRTGDGRELISHVANVRALPTKIAPILTPQGKAYALQRIMVAIEGAAQGWFHADPGVAKPFQFPALQLEFGIEGTRDSQSGQSTGKRLHTPVAITRRLGPSTPQLWQALANNENLTSVRFGCFGIPKEGGGAEAEFFTLKLTNAGVAAAELELPNTKTLTSAPVVQRASFTYAAIEWTWLEGGISAQDDWS